ncbi:deoxyribonuclease tatdn2-related [Anaeramoeba flamelloides]|uniref:Deoxyribonuclease tatdn2-related n=1 Tax=Anaeramoeba flamelloides TaxID=1746091 RepID=A0AAV7YA49_9EUKA|nr:deoxyribonuclease tatdn2-related [Anaeramoeba flamelloides]
MSQKTNKQTVQQTNKKTNKKTNNQTNNKKKNNKNNNKNNNRNNKNNNTSKKKKQQTSKTLTTNFPYVDTHCHLEMILKKLKITHTDKTYEEIKNKLEFPEGFEGMLIIGCEPETFTEVHSFLNFETDEIRLSFGVHPHNAKDYTNRLEKKIIKYSKLDKVVAVGEIGLDYHYMHSPKHTQQEVFIKQIKIAVSLDKPIVLHSREAEEDTLRIMKEHVPQEHLIHLHCFTSSNTFLRQMLDHFPNLYVGFTGIITFKGKSCDPIREAVKIVPLDRILSETDGPFMGPVPFRGKVAHPGRIPWIINKIAELKEIEKEEAYSQIRQNAKTIYKF